MVCSAKAGGKAELGFMQPVFGLENVAAAWNESTISIGVFDGVHLGHQAVISAAKDDASKHERPCVVLTFDKNPLAVLRPDKCPGTILSTALKLEKIEKLGADVCIVADFDNAFASQTREEFFENILRQKLKAAAVVVGHDFAFGKDRAGNVNWLAQQIQTTVIPALQMNGRRVSSSEIRRDIENGLMQQAKELLGDAFALDGLVVHGLKLGKELGFPTANIEPVTQGQILPKMGIYAGKAVLQSRSWPSAISVGARPSIEGAGFAVEAFLIDYPGMDFYGERIVLEFEQRLRDERRFDSHELLAEQIRRDVQQARDVLELKNA